MNAPPRWFSAERMIELLQRQVNCYERLRSLSDRQRGLIHGDQPEGLLSVLRERQGLVNELSRLNEQLAPFRRDWDGAYRFLTPEQQDLASGLLAQINRMLRLILDTDEEDGRLLAARKQAVGQELAGAADRRTAQNAYARQAGAARL